MYKTLVLSLEKDVERRKHIDKVVKGLGLDYEFFNALTPEDLSPYHLKEYFKSIDIFNYPKLNHYNVLATFLSQLELIKYSFTNKVNLLVLEDDLIPVRDFDFKNVDFSKFDIFQLMSEVSCCCYFVNHNSAENIYNTFINSRPTQAFDWELFKLKETFRIVTVGLPVFIQSDKFISNLAPNGY